MDGALKIRVAGTDMQVNETDVLAGQNCHAAPPWRIIGNLYIKGVAILDTTNGYYHYQVQPSIN